MMFNSPISPERAEEIIGTLSVYQGDCCVDVGCGRGEFLIRVIESSNATGLGIDIDRHAILAARDNAVGRVRKGACEFRESDVLTEMIESGSFDLAICIGSTHAFGSGESAYPAAIDRLLQLVRPGGHVLIGETYWEQPPAAEYLKLIGEPVGTYRDHTANVSVAARRGMVLLNASQSSQQEWDHFEQSHLKNVERNAALHPDASVRTERIKRGRDWYEGYSRWGRSSMGFACYLFQTPGGDITN